MRRVAITGLGSISALGRNTTEFAESLRHGRCGIGPVESADMSQMRFQNGAEVRGYCHRPYFDDRRADFIFQAKQFFQPRCQAEQIGGVNRDGVGNELQIAAAVFRLPRLLAKNSFYRARMTE